jgi:hypothetical protein
MSVNTRIDRLKSLEAEIQRLLASARVERATSWVNGSGPAKAAEYTRKARELESLHAHACHQWSARVDERIQAALKAGCFVLGFVLAAGC